MQIATDIADATGTVDVGRVIEEIGDSMFEPRANFSPSLLMPPGNLDAELDLLSNRMSRVGEYARAARLNRITFDAPRPRVALVGAGLGYQAALRALDELGIGEADRECLGLRLVSLGMPWPLDREQLRSFCSGVETVLVIEDKLPFIESQLRDALYRTDGAPLVLGKQDREGKPLLPLRAFVTADDVATALARIIDINSFPDVSRYRLKVLESGTRHSQRNVLLRRIPYFCSGCPHNTSTRAAPDQLVGLGIGCHALASLDTGERRGRIVGITQMGGEGANWIGLAPFTDDHHFIQNLGDGTFHHSGSLAVRAAVASGVTMTFKLLYNDAVAMTGGQQPQGMLDVPALTKLLEAEGVARTIVTTPEPGRYRRVRLAKNASVRHRDELLEVQRDLAKVEGVTVLLHDDRCANEKRRMRKRGQLEVPSERVVINERVCEGCGDCAEQSTCLSLMPVFTEFGRKTQIQQSSCNLDRSCLKGDCPSFMLVTPVGLTAQRSRSAPEPPAEFPRPALRVPEDLLVRLPGIGGTGVITVSAILQTAAYLDGQAAAGLDQIGLAQKGGPVVSDIRLGRGALEGQIRASRASVDVILGLDLIDSAADDVLAIADPSRTIAILNTSISPTAPMITDPHSIPPHIVETIARVDAATRSGENLYLDAARMAERLFGDHLASNMILVGAAFQHGCLPVSDAALEQAIRLNGTAVDANIKAFRWGRAAVAAPDTVQKALAPSQGDGSTVDPDARRRVEPIGLPSALTEIVTRCYGELIRYQDTRYAERYVADVLHIFDRERAAADGANPVVTTAYARSLFKLMAYKDEYEVARLHLLESERQRIESEFGEGASVKVLLHPPVLRAFGLKRKIALGRSALVALRVLHHLRRLRGTRYDPFGRARIRQMERGLIIEYRDLVERGLAYLTPITANRVASLAGLADIVRGYEAIKLRNVDEFRRQSRELLEELSVEPHVQNTAAEFSDG
jgi:indolepyruvate ferredoxin oxidoreductase